MSTPRSDASRHVIDAAEGRHDLKRAPQGESTVGAAETPHRTPVAEGDRDDKLREASRG